MSFIARFFLSLLVIFTTFFYGFSLKEQRHYSVFTGKDWNVSGYHRDGWTREVFRWNLEGVNPLNRLSFTLKEHQFAPKGDIYFCDKKLKTITTERRFNLPIFACDKPELKIVSETFDLSKTSSDKRKIGLGIDSIHINSRIGLMIPGWFNLGIAAFFSFMVALATYIATYSTTNAQRSEDQIPQTVRGDRKAQTKGALADSTLANFAGRFGGLIVALAINTVIVVVSYSAVPTANLASMYNLYALISCICLLVGGLSLPIDLRRKEILSVRVPKSSWTLILLLIVALGIRAYGIDFGLPAPYHPDETPKFHSVEKMAHYGDLNPRYFLHPPLLIYSSYFLSHIISFCDPSLSFEHAVKLGGRITSMLAGVGSVWLLFLLGKVLYSRTCGLVAATLLTFSPLAVTCSRYMKEDSLLVFFLLATVTCVAKFIFDGHKLRFILLAGLLAGIASASKYTGILAVGGVAGTPIFVYLFKRQAFSWRLASVTLLAILLAGVTFALINPYSILESAAFLRGFGAEAHHMKRGHGTMIDPWSQLWMYHYRRSLLGGMNLIPLLLGTLGIGYLIKRRRVQDVFIVGLILLFYLPAEYVNAKPAPQPERYVLPAIPFLAIAAAVVGERLLLCRGRIIAYVGIFALLVMPMYNSVLLAANILPDTRQRARNWIEENLPKGVRIACVYPPYDLPDSMPDYKYGSDHFVATWVRGGFNEVIRLASEGQFENEYDYVIISSLSYDRLIEEPNLPRVRRDLMKRFYSHMELVKKFSNPDGKYGFNNPTIKIMKLKKR